MYGQGTRDTAGNVVDDGNTEADHLQRKRPAEWHAARRVAAQAEAQGVECYIEEDEEGSPRIVLGKA